MIAVSSNYLKGIVGISRPFQAFFLTFLYFVIPLILIDKSNYASIVIGFGAMVFFFLGHFCLNAICDKEVDIANPRKNIWNSWHPEQGVNVREIRMMIIIFWIFSILLTVYHTFLFHKSLIILILISKIFSIVYSVRPIQVKGKAPWDLIIDLVSFGIFGPVFVVETMLITFPLNYYLLLLTFTISTIGIVVLPTIIMDKKYDQKHDYLTFVVKFGIFKTQQIIKLFLVIQLISLFLFLLISIGTQNYLLFMAIILLTNGERKFLRKVLISKEISEKSAEVVNDELTRGFLNNGFQFLLAVYFLRIIGYEFNDVMGNIIHFIRNY